MVPSYPSIFSLGHRYLNELLFDEVVVEEKIDGSQFSFGTYIPKGGDTWYGSDEDVISCRSKGAEINVFAPDKMFNKGVEWIKDNVSKFHPGWIYRGEYLNKPKHNVLAYDRVPANNIILFDVTTGLETYLPYDQKCIEAARLGLEVVPAFFKGKIDSADFLRDLLETTSILGGQKVEGVVIKNYNRFGIDKKILIGKFVSEVFKEFHQREWKSSGSKDIVTLLIESYKTPARWAKGVQHLREAGLLEDAPKDIGALFKEIPKDVRLECEDDIKQKLFDWAWPNIQRGILAGLPEWYKQKLLDKQFEV